MIITPKTTPISQQLLRFSADVIGRAVSLGVAKYFLVRAGQQAAASYEKYCKSPYDYSACSSFYLRKELGAGVERSINAIGGVFVAAVLLSATGVLGGMIYRRFTKRTTEAAKQPLLPIKPF